MPPLAVAVALLLAAYLVGAIPFGYLIGRARGVDLFAAGSGNIGATNAARVLGRKFGILVFVLDFLKGAVPVAAVVPLARLFAPDADVALGSPDILRVGTALLAFLGHLFPIYLGFHGGKGVATGAGTIFVLVPGPAALAVLMWVAVLFASRIVSLASLAAVTILVLARLAGTPAPFALEALPVTLYLLVATGFVFLKHRSNVRRLMAGTESQFLADDTRRRFWLRAFHIVPLGMWFGGATFFNFMAAVPIFESFKNVVYTNPSDRTAYVTIIPADAPVEKQEALAKALAGAAVGPLFPRLFLLELVCGAVALLTALAWWRSGQLGRWRVYVIGAALALVVVGWPVSSYVSELRLERFNPDPTAAAAASAAFGSWHMVSLLLATVTTWLAGVALVMAAGLPRESPPTTAVTC